MTYLGLSLVILSLAVCQCITVFTHVFRANRTADNARSTDNDSDTDHDGESGTGHSQVDPSWTATNFSLRCTYVFSLLLAIGLVVCTGLFLRPLSESDQKRFQAALLALLVSVPRVRIGYELLHLRNIQILRLTNDSYRYAVWIGWGYCVVLLEVLYILIGVGIDPAILSNISLAFSSVEYFVAAFGYVAVYRGLIFRSRRRLLVVLGAKIISCFLVGIIALILLALTFIVDFDLVLFQWAHAIVTGLSLLRFLVFNHTRHTTSSPTLATWDSHTTSQSELIDYGGGKTRVNPRPTIEDPAWSQVTAYKKTMHLGAIEERSSEVI